jgi:hypothetical protein
VPVLQRYPRSKPPAASLLASAVVVSVTSNT